MSVHSCVRLAAIHAVSSVIVFKTIRLQDHWANVDETWHILYSVGLGTQLLGSGILNFGRSELSPVVLLLLVCVS